MTESPLGMRPATWSDVETFSSTMEQNVLFFFNPFSHIISHSIYPAETGSHHKGEGMRSVWNPSAFWDAHKTLVVPSNMKHTMGKTAARKKQLVNVWSFQSITPNFKVPRAAAQGQLLAYLAFKNANLFQIYMQKRIRLTVFCVTSKLLLYIITVLTFTLMGDKVSKLAFMCEIEYKSWTVA